MKCKDCKFFEREQDGHNTCSSPEFVYQRLESDEQLAYWDYEGYAAGVYVGENFGCIHFEKASK